MYRFVIYGLGVALLLTDCDIQHFRSRFSSHSAADSRKNAAADMRVSVWIICRISCDAG